MYHLEKKSLALLAMNILIINYCLICLALFYQLDPLVLQWNFVADNIKLIFSMSDVNIVVDTKLQPINYLHISNQTKYIY